LAHKVFDLLLLDVNLPTGARAGRSGGVELIKFVRNTLKLKHLPVIVFGEQQDAALLKECLDLGVQKFLPRTWIGAERLGAVMVQELVRSALDEKRMYDREQEYEVTHKLITDLTEVILPLGVSLSAEKDFNRLLEKILLQTRSLCNADAGSIYLRTEADTLRFVTVYTLSLKLAMGGTTGIAIPFPELHLYDADTGKPNQRNVATYSA